MAYVALVVGTIVVIVLDNRSPVKTIAWLLVLTFLPVLGLILYFFVGRTHRKEKIISRRSYDRLMKLPMAEYLQQQGNDDVPDAYKRIISLFKNTSRALPFGGNALQVFSSGAEWLDALLAELERATNHIHLQSYIFADDPVGRQVRDVLVRKARQGVKVRVIYDDVGCWHVPGPFFESMREVGIEVHGFLKVRFPLFANKVNYRNHRKVVVIDGKVGFVGGMNIAWRYVHGLPWGCWRDTHMLMCGRAVHGLQTAFVLDWYFTDHTLLSDSSLFPEIPDEGGALVQVVTSTPVGPGGEIAQGLVKAIHSARHYFYLQTPYFIPTEPLLNALKVSALAGVDVRLMIPERSDTHFTQQAAHSYLAELLDAGVRVYRYKAGFLHSKMLVSDDELSTIGSTNLDFRSLEHNFEINAFVYDSKVAQHCKSLFLSDQRQCEQLFLKNWQKRSWHRKVIESAARLLSPLM